MEKLIACIFGFIIGVCFIVVLCLCKYNLMVIESRLDKVERVNEVQNGVIVEFLHKGDGNVL